MLHLQRCRTRPLLTRWLRAGTRCHPRRRRTAQCKSCSTSQCQACHMRRQGHTSSTCIRMACSSPVCRRPLRRLRICRRQDLRRRHRCRARTCTRRPMVRTWPSCNSRTVYSRCQLHNVRQVRGLRQRCHPDARCEGAVAVQHQETVRDQQLVWHDQLLMSVNNIVVWVH